MKRILAARSGRKTNKTITFLPLLLAAMVATFNTSITHSVLPVLAIELNASSTQVTWIVDAFTVSMTGTVLLGGAIGDRYGRTRLLIIGSVLLAVTSFTSAMADTAAVLIATRALAGISTGLMFPATLAIISATCEQASERRKWIAVWSAATGVGTAAGPMIGGWLTELLSWKAVYLATLPAIFIVILLQLIFGVKSSTGNISSRIDWLGGLLLGATLACIVISISVFPDSGVAVAGGWLGAGSLLAVITAAVERGRHDRIIDLSIFRKPETTIAAAIIMVGFSAMNGFLFVASQFTQNVMDLSPGRAGIIMLPLSLAFIGGAIVVARLQKRVSSGYLIAIGMLLMAASFSGGLFWSLDTGQLGVIITYILVGGGLGLSLAPATAILMNAISDSKAGVGSAVNDLARNAGSAIGVSIWGSLLAIKYSRSLSSELSELVGDARADQIVAAIGNSISGVIVAGRYLPEPAADKLRLLGQEAFVKGQATAMIVGSIGCLVAAVLAFIFIGRRRIQPEI